MASGRAYTKSGSTEKYESGQWSTPSWSGTAGSVSTPDSSGNYTVTAPTNYAESTSSDYSVTCTTKYGGVSKIFYFKQSMIFMGTITVSATSVHVIGGATRLSAVFNWSISGSASSYTGDQLYVRLDCTNSNGGSWEISGTILVYKSSGTYNNYTNYSGTSGGTWKWRFVNTSDTFKSTHGNYYWSVKYVNNF